MIATPAPSGAPDRDRGRLVIIKPAIPPESSGAEVPRSRNGDPRPVASLGTCSHAVAVVRHGFLIVADKPAPR